MSESRGGLHPIPFYLLVCRYVIRLMLLLVILSMRRYSYHDGSLFADVVFINSAYHKSLCCLAH